MHKKITLILLITFFVGLSILLYPSISQFWNSKVQSRAISKYEEILSNISEEDENKIVNDANDYNKKLFELETPLLEYDKVNGYYDTLDINGNGMMGYISIDKLKVELPVYHGTSAEVLNSAAGHIKGTSIPVGGDSTHAVISAHRGLPSAKLFTDLDKLEVGDIFVFNFLNNSITYQVDQVKIVEPNNVQDIQILKNKDYFTLLTCTPYGINTHRLLVRGVRIENISEKKMYINAEAYLIDRTIVTSVIALPILFILILYIIFKPVKKGEEDEIY